MVLLVCSFLALLTSLSLRLAASSECIACDRISIAALLALSTSASRLTTFSSRDATLASLVLIATSRSLVFRRLSSHFRASSASDSFCASSSSATA